MKKKLLSAFLSLFLVAAFAASPALFQRFELPGQVHIKPQAVPTSLTAIASSEASIIGLVITNPTASAITILLQDGQGSPIPLLGTNSLAANTTTVANIPFGYWCPGGWSIQAGGAGLTYYATWRQ